MVAMPMSHLRRTLDTLVGLKETLDADENWLALYSWGFSEDDIVELVCDPHTIDENDVNVIRDENEKPIRIEISRSLAKVFSL